MVSGFSDMEMRLNGCLGEHYLEGEHRLLISCHRSSCVSTLKDSFKLEYSAEKTLEGLGNTTRCQISIKVLFVFRPQRILLSLKTRLKKRPIEGLASYQVNIKVLNYLLPTERPQRNRTRIL